tara:strand:- start:167 stop:400 length:234 start_codon:yes stop_codon:yes gene_type:complete
MLSIENATWIVIGLVAASYISQRHARIAAMRMPSAPTVEVINPLRWRHDGSQRPLTRDGNRAPIVDPVADRMVRAYF